MSTLIIIGDGTNLKRGGRGGKKKEGRGSGNPGAVLAYCVLKKGFQGGKGGKREEEASASVPTLRIHPAAKKKKKKTKKSGCVFLLLDITFSLSLGRTRLGPGVGNQGGEEKGRGLGVHFGGTTTSNGGNPYKYLERAQTTRAAGERAEERKWFPLLSGRTSGEGKP